MKLPELANHLRSALGVQHKREIQAVGRHLPVIPGGPWGAQPVRLGDDCAAIPDGDGYLLLAAEGMWPELVASEPHFAAYCSVLVNASDVYSMGGRPLAIVDTLFATSPEAAEPMWQGLAEASRRLGLPVVGGHTNLHSPHDGLSAAVLGRAQRLFTSFSARPGDVLIAAYDLRGTMHARYPFWNASAGAHPARIRGDYAVLPRLAEGGLDAAAKDISMGGLAGTSLMLLEASAVGATLSLDTIPRPSEVPWSTWLLAFPSYGFLMSVAEKDSRGVLDAFASREIAAAVVGTVDVSRRLTVSYAGDRALVWDLAQAPLTGLFESRAS
jgi:AIR synthase-related protein